MASAINVSVDTELKKQAEEVFACIGMTTQDAIRMFLRQAVRERALPLRTSIDEVKGARNARQHRLERELGIESKAAQARAAKAAAEEKAAETFAKLKDELSDF